MDNINLDKYRIRNISKRMQKKGLQESIGEEFRRRIGLGHEFWMTPGEIIFNLPACEDEPLDFDLLVKLEPRLQFLFDLAVTDIGGDWGGYYKPRLLVLAGTDFTGTLFCRHVRLTRSLTTRFIKGFVGN